MRGLIGSIIIFYVNFSAVIPRNAVPNSNTSKKSRRVALKCMSACRGVAGSIVNYNTRNQTICQFYSTKMLSALYSTEFFLGQYRIIRQGNLARNFSSQICCENAGILCVFQTFHSGFVGEKNRQSPQTQLCGVALGIHTGLIISFLSVLPVPQDKSHTESAPASQQSAPAPDEPQSRMR